MDLVEVEDILYKREGGRDLSALWHSLDVFFLKIVANMQISWVLICDSSGYKAINNIVIGVFLMRLLYILNRKVKCREIDFCWSGLTGSFGLLKSKEASILDTWVMILFRTWSATLDARIWLVRRNRVKGFAFGLHARFAAGREISDSSKTLHPLLVSMNLPAGLCFGPLVKNTRNIRLR